jgi:hypothetical protein
VRFEVSRVTDAIEQRLTTDAMLAQAVVDLGAVVRFLALDGGRPINLLRIGMVVDALGRYLIDAGAMLYPVAGRELLSDSALTSKERMVLGRWADDGIIEVTPVVSDRPVEIADFTGVPLVAVHNPMEFAGRFRWLADNPERVLRVVPRTGGAALTPADIEVALAASVPQVVVGKAALRPDTAAQPALRPDTAGVAPGTAISFTVHGVQRFGRTRVNRSRFTRAEPSGMGASLMARQWRCVEPHCPAFGEHRAINQPLPRMRVGVPACPRHGSAVKDVGPRPPAAAVDLVVDDLARRRFVVSAARPVVVGRAPAEADDHDVVPVAGWLHEAASAWISDEHVRLEIRDGALVVTDTSRNGTVVWKRSGPDDARRTERVHSSSHRLGDWDSVELYTGVELVPGDRRLVTVVGSEPRSVLVDAPTVATRRLS